MSLWVSSCKTSIKCSQTQSIQSNTKNFKEHPKISIGERGMKTCNQPLCIDPQGPRNPQVDASTYIKWINIIPQCHYGYPMQDVHQVFSNQNIQSNIKISQRERFNSSQHDSEGITSYDPTILTKHVIHQDHDISRTREREREIEHIATGTYPQPRGWTTPSSSWPPSGWWRWPPEMISPLRQGTGKAPDWFFPKEEGRWST